MQSRTQTIQRFKSLSPVKLNVCSREDILAYFQDAWQLEEMLMKSLIGEETFYLQPDPLRNELIFYLGHSAAFYITKLLRVGLLERPINPQYEILFERGVDPETSEELDAATKEICWPDVQSVWQYRDRAYEQVLAVIDNAALDLPIDQNHPLWALMMGIEHNRIHFETSSMLIRQLPVDRVCCPEGWHYAPAAATGAKNEMILISGGEIEWGKPTDSPTYGWDSEYGYRRIEVQPFLASQYLITNREFEQFVSSNGYDIRDYWDEESWDWKTKHQVNQPKFWLSHNGSYRYRAMFDEIDLPPDWPVEVNCYEARAFCRWKGDGVRLMSEAEWNLAAAKPSESNQDDDRDYNFHFKFGSPTPVNRLETPQHASGLYDLRGNVWEWLSDTFNPLPGFKPHPLYEDYSAPFFDRHHSMMLGGAWVTTGTETSMSYRNWFRHAFYQHAGFRTAQSAS